MTRTVFEDLTFFWGYWTLFETAVIALLWQNRSRVLGDRLYRIPVVRRIGRGACERRVEALSAELERRGVPAGARPGKDALVERWHRIVVGRCVSVLLQAVPLLIVVLPFWWATSLARTSATPFWMFAAVTGFGVVSIALMAADERAAAVSDAAGALTVEAVRFLETLLITDDRRPQDSALDIHGRAFGRLCQALRAQARHTTRRMPPAARTRARETTERLIGALAEADQRYLFGEGPDRDTAVRALSRLAAGALRHSCLPRAQRDSLVIIDATLLTNAPEPDVAHTAPESFGSRLRARAGKAALVVAFLAGAFLFPEGGALSVLLALAGLAVISPFREALYRVKDFVAGGSAAGATELQGVGEELGRPAPATFMSCSHCGAHSPVTAGSRPVG
ncbi:hypothetical protein [Streptomyces griseoviridis]|uniref:Integral membrane protein n=1 Tax=Streptomyces griseoviridis TaxID=45398 RepID=A0ABT9LCJ2_STRGD|nr:hypothetical protein [Streptomyces griseoviridis]MDP9681449.1 hypothetical protein [Streptomyces griseoviridis]